jgi:hypothetical protein
MKLILKKSPNHGDRRIIEKFLLFSVEIDDEWRWLERAKILQIYIAGFGWTNMDWAE